MDDNKLCHCDSILPYNRCCGPIIRGSSIAASAKQLMRSRFSAFQRGDIDYLIASHHPSQRRYDDKKQLAESLNECEWLNLSIVDTQQGTADHSQGEVEFFASYLRNGQQALLHERSRFVKEEGKWFYLNGDIFDTQSNKAAPF